MLNERKYMDSQINLNKQSIADRERVGNVTFQTFIWETEQEGSGIWENLSPKIKSGMATTYQEGFAGSPWEEKYKCNNQECRVEGIFYPEKPESGHCLHCGGTEIGDAYPKNELLEKLFPELIGGIKSGILNIALDNEKGVIGFAIGGISTPENVKKGHFRNEEWPAVRRQIYDQSGLREKDEIFYLDELVVRPDCQFRKVGSGLASRSVEKAIKSGSIICGLTISGSPVLTISRKQFTQAGYEMVTIPLGNVDQYRGPGNRERTWYTARPVNANFRNGMQKN